jgi:sporulation integral membrane protein YlbJ
VKKYVLNILVIIITAFMILFPEKSISYSKQALGICYEIIIPSLFPFFVCSGILVYSGFAQTLSALFRPVMKPLFNVNENGAAAFVLGIISGYPLGAVTACQLYEGAYISKSEAERLLAFCNNSGPLFILGAVGTAMFKNSKTGIILYIAHIISAVLVGILAGFYQKDKFCAPKSRIRNAYENPSEIFSKVLLNSINSILTVCGAIIFFFTISGIIIGIIPLSPPLNALFSALLEFTGGIKKISLLSAPLGLRIILSSFCVGFAGLCVHIQVMAVTSRYGLSLKPYIFGKFLHGFFSAAITYILLKLFPQTVSVFNMSNARFSGGFYFGSMYVIFSALAILFIYLVTLFMHNKRDA